MELHWAREPWLLPSPLLQLPALVTTECYPWSCNFALAKQGALPNFINGSSALLEKIGFQLMWHKP